MTIPEKLTARRRSASEAGSNRGPSFYGAVLMIGVLLCALSPQIGLPETEPREYVWTNTLGPPGGLGYDTRIDPRNTEIVFTTDQWAGMCKSYDGGYTWFPRNEGINSRFGPSLDSVPIFCCTIDPYDSNIVWCGTYGMRGVYKSFDGGETWNKMDRGIPDYEGMSFRSFTIDPTDTNIVYTGVEIPRVGENRSRGMIFKTVDGGENWFSVLQCDALVRHIMINYENTDVLYTATGIFDRWDVHWEGILKTEDGGQTWLPVNNGLLDEDGLGSLVVGGLTIHPEDPNILYCATGRHQGFGAEPDPRHGQLFKTTNGGASWSTIAPAYRAWNAIELAPSDPDIVYASCEHEFYRSRNGGRTWSKKNLGLAGIYAGVPITITIDPNDPDRVFVNSYTGGLYFSLDAGEFWVNAMVGFTGAEMTDVAMNPYNPSVVLAVGRPGPFKSVDGGLHWLGTGEMARSWQPRPEWSAVCVKPDEPNVVLAADQFFGELYKSVDRGQFWSLVMVIMPSDQVEYPFSLHGFKTIAFAPSDTSIVYAGARIPDKTIEFDRTTPFDETRPSMGVYKSVDGGDTWHPMNDGLGGTTKNINEIVVHPTNPDIAYASTLNSGIYKTIDGAGHWVSINNGITRNDIRSLAIDPKDPDVLYAGAESAGVFKTENGGLNWRQINVGLDAEATIRGVAVDPQNSDRVYAGDWHTGAYVSEDAGGVWRHINEGLDNRAITALDISADGNVLYVATQGGGVFRLGDVATTGTLQGWVSDAVTGEGIPGVSVSLSLMPDPVYTDVNGEFVMRDVVAGVCTLDATAATYKPYQETDLLVAGGEVKIVEITLCRRLYPALTPWTNGKSFQQGDIIRIGADLEHRGPSILADLFITIDTPAGLLFFDGAGFSPNITPFSIFIMTGAYLSVELGEFVASDSLPSGTYTIYGVIAKPNTYDLYSMVRTTSFDVEPTLMEDRGNPE